MTSNPDAEFSPSLGASCNDEHQEGCHSLAKAVSNHSAEDAEETGWDLTAPFSPRAVADLQTGATLDGTSGVYLLTDREGHGVAVFKPDDEEQLPEDAHKWALVRGQGLYRERAAFLVSARLAGPLSGVPNTIIATHGGRRGSLQRFVPESADMSDMGPSGIPVDQVHKVGALDILLFNTDRHEGNLLVARPSRGRVGSALVPIDHGLCLPEIVSRARGANIDLLTTLYFAWESWPQVSVTCPPVASVRLGRALYPLPCLCCLCCSQDQLTALGHRLERLSRLNRWPTSAP